MRLPMVLLACRRNWSPVASLRLKWCTPRPGLALLALPYPPVPSIHRQPLHAPTTTLPPSTWSWSNNSPLLLYKQHESQFYRCRDWQPWHPLWTLADWLIVLLRALREAVFDSETFFFALLFAPPPQPLATCAARAAVWVR
ncbi:uncharacterized protein EI97DRAFT_127363 [Westerdykella ornata]|uniref:Uncharacterized protein n=1 Tax=Westerdykella ornata TaxID=318751 RepID=A0A6A6JDK9_WESOR|nr:uncharacterized protein EI97DRAFT_127363 [Westerdykella ornata]KAF2274367.1 hypothetical protein EI97DRAFT_127363 [Westerdykella ornata]